MEIDATCSVCGEALAVKIEDGTIVRRHQRTRILTVEVSVEPCARCREAAEERGRDEGFEEGRRA